MEPQEKDPSAVVWKWRTAGEQAEARTIRATAEARSARLRGALQGAIGLLLATAVYFFWRPGVAIVVAAVAVATALLALAAPLTLYRQLTALLEKLGRAVGMLVTWLLMPVLFFLLFLPVGLVLRARRRLGITRAPDPRLPTYWASTGERARPAESYRRQF